MSSATLQPLHPHPNLLIFPVPSFASRAPLTLSNLYVTILPFILLLLMASLARVRGTWPLRMGLLPFSIAITSRAFFGYYCDDPILVGANHGIGKSSQVAEKERLVQLMRVNHCRIIGCSLHHSSTRPRTQTRRCIKGGGARSTFVSLPIVPKLVCILELHKRTRTSPQTYIQRAFFLSLISSTDIFITTPLYFNSFRVLLQRI